MGDKDGKKNKQNQNIVIQLSRPVPSWRVVTPVVFHTKLAVRTRNYLGKLRTADTLQNGVPYSFRKNSLKHTGWTGVKTDRTKKKVLAITARYPKTHFFSQPSILNSGLIRMVLVSRPLRFVPVFPVRILFHWLHDELRRARASSRKHFLFIFFSTTFILCEIPHFRRGQYPSFLISCSLIINSMPLIAGFFLDKYLRLLFKIVHTHRFCWERVINHLLMGRRLPIVDTVSMNLLVGLNGDEKN